MPRIGLTPDVVTHTAAAIIDRDGLAALTLAKVAAELGVRSPSLYNHVDGLDALVRLVAIRGVDELAEECRSAVMGRSGKEAVDALASAYRAFAKNRPGVYLLTQIARPDDAEYEVAARRVLEPVLAVFAGMGYEGDGLIHATRSFRAALHGFVTLEGGRGFGLDVSVDESFEWLVAVLERGFRP